METVMDHIGADGVVTAGFAGAMKEALGEGYAETKYFDDITSIVGMAKRGIDTKVNNTELSEAAKTSIKRPTADASDDDKAAFRKTLLTEAGATGNIADYVVTKPADLPEGLPFNEAGAKEMAEMCCSQDIPLDIYNAIVESSKQHAFAAFNMRQTQSKEAFDAGVKVVTDAHQPDKITEMGRLAFRYVKTHGLPSGDKKAADAIMGGETGEKDANGAIALGPDNQPKRYKSMHENPNDFAEWNRRGVSPGLLVHMATVGEKMQSGTTIPGGGTGGSETVEEKAEREYVARCNANSPDLLPTGA